MRLSGFATGLDINQMVTDLMRAERMPMDRMKQDQQLIEWRMEEYRSLNLKLDQLRTSIFDGVLRQANMLANKPTSSNESVVTATASSGSDLGTYSISQVSLASAATAKSESAISDSEKIDMKAALKTEGFSSGFTWETGAVIKESFSTTTDQGTIDLEKPLNEEGLIVTINGRSMEVITEQGVDLLENQVRLNPENDQIEFASPLAANQIVEVISFEENATKTLTLEDDQPSLNIGVKNLHDGENALTVTLAGNTLSIVTDSEAVLEEDQVYVNYETGELKFADGVSGEVEVTYEQYYTASDITTFDNDGKEIKSSFVFTGDQSMENVIKEMNDSEASINVFYDDFSDRLSVMRTETGRFNPNEIADTEPQQYEAEITFSGAFFEEALKLENSTDGSNAKFTVNGLDTERHSNTFTMNGVTMTLHAEYESVNPIMISTSTDVDAIFDTVMSFIDDYNELVDLSNEKLGEEFFRDYRPLTDDQREAMSDREIERWEEQAMSGLLRNDRTIRSGFNRFRIDMYTPVNTGVGAEFNQIAQIGITTTNNYRDGGKLEVNEDKLRVAIEKDAEAVFQLFAGDGTGNADKGVARRVRESANGMIEQLSQRAGGLRGRNLNHQFTLGRQMNNLDDRISNFERRMQQVEERYWSQFTAMEKAVAQANSQGEALFAQLFGGM